MYAGINPLTDFLTLFCRGATVMGGPEINIVVVLTVGTAILPRPDALPVKQGIACELGYPFAGGKDTEKIN